MLCMCIIYETGISASYLYCNINSARRKKILQNLIDCGNKNNKKKKEIQANKLKKYNYLCINSSNKNAAINYYESRGKRVKTCKKKSQAYLLFNLLDISTL